METRSQNGFKICFKIERPDTIYGRKFNHTTLYLPHPKYDLDLPDCTLGFAHYLFSFFNFTLQNLNERKRRQIVGENWKKEGYVSAPQKAREAP